MEQQQNNKRGRINLRALNNAFITNIKSSSTGITKRCICIPIDDNFITENAYIQKNTGREIRSAELSFSQWFVSQQNKDDFLSRFGKEKKQDWDLRLDISKNALESLQQRDPSLAARLDRKNPNFDRELSNNSFPFIGQAFELLPSLPAPEPTPTVEVHLSDTDNDLPF